MIALSPLDSRLAAVITRPFAACRTFGRPRDDRPVAARLSARGG